jgi:hypothetical protein
MPNNKLKDNFRVIKHAEDFAANFNFMDSEQEQALRREMHNSEEHVFVVKYSIKMDDFGRKECVTEQILPSRVGSLMQMV